MNQFLTTETLYKKAPSIFTEGSASKTSDKYQHISTHTIINSLIKEGFQPTWAHQSKARLQDKKAFTKHMVRLRHVDAAPNNAGLYPELVLVNSHDGLSSYRLMAGIYRVICGNGLIAGNTFDEVRVRHQGDILNNVIEGTFSVVNTAHQMIEVADEMSTITLTPTEKQIFAESAHSLRFDEDDQSIGVNNILNVRRLSEKNKNDLFTVFNVVQENIIKGGLKGYKLNEFGRLKRVTTRDIKSIDQNIKLNKALWSLAEKMRELKQ